MKDILAQIVKDVRARVKEQSKTRPTMRMEIKAFQRRSLLEAIENAKKVPLIAEVKPASPSAGNIGVNINVLQTAKAMVSGGAIAISVLTEPKYFKGDPGYLPMIRKAVEVPVLRKDFIVDEYQLYESAELGADAVLLIAEILKDNLKRFIQLAHGLGMESLVEIHDKGGLDHACAAGAEIIGINNRNLKTMSIDLNKTAQLAPLVPHNITLVSESGICEPKDVKFVLDAGADAVLVGTAIMRAEDIKKKVRALVNAR
jgi:indole-3-glycerol phosphate synthase